MRMYDFLINESRDLEVVLCKQEMAKGYTVIAFIIVSYMDEHITPPTQFPNSFLGAGGLEFKVWREPIPNSI